MEHNPLGDYEMSPTSESAVVALFFGFTIGYVAGAVGLCVGVFKLARKAVKR